MDADVVAGCAFGLARRTSDPAVLAALLPLAEPVLPGRAGGAVTFRTRLTAEAARSLARGVRSGRLAVAVAQLTDDPDALSLLIPAGSDADRWRHSGLVDVLIDHSAIRLTDLLRLVPLASDTRELSDRIHTVVHAGPVDAGLMQTILNAGHPGAVRIGLHAYASHPRLCSADAVRLLITAEAASSAARSDDPEPVRAAARTLIARDDIVDVLARDDAGRASPATLRTAVLSLAGTELQPMWVGSIRYLFTALHEAPELAGEDGQVSDDLAAALTLDPQAADSLAARADLTAAGYSRLADYIDGWAVALQAEGGDVASVVQADRQRAQVWETLAANPAVDPQLLRRAPVSPDRVGALARLLEHAGAGPRIWTLAAALPDVLATAADAGAAFDALSACDTAGMVPNPATGPQNTGR